MKEQWILVNANATVSKQKGNRQQFRRFVVANLLHAYLEIYTEEILSRILFAYQMYFTRDFNLTHHFSNYYGKGVSLVFACLYKGLLCRLANEVTSICSICLFQQIILNLSPVSHIMGLNGAPKNTNKLLK